MEYEVLVQLKGEVLDPEGRAIAETLKAQGFSAVSSITTSKRYVLTVASSDKDPDETVRSIAERYLANPVAQTFTVRRLS